MPTRGLLSEAQRARFSAVPEMDARDLARRHTLSEADLTTVGVRRGAANRLGFAVQLCLLRRLMSNCGRRRRSRNLMLAPNLRPKVVAHNGPRLLPRLWRTKASRG